ncbi:MAG: cytochrome c, partial [Roseiflexaceae bacterium]|nr:cytochrome c [Roseiflexaceae bacterium]
MKQQRRSARVIGTYSAIAAVVLLVVLVEAWVSRRDAPAQPPPDLRTTSAAPSAVNRDIRTVLAGQQVYRFYCASCHGGESTANGSVMASDLLAPARLD